MIASPIPEETRRLDTYAAQSMDRPTKLAISAPQISRITRITQIHSRGNWTDLVARDKEARPWVYRVRINLRNPRNLRKNFFGKYRALGVCVAERAHS